MDIVISSGMMMINNGFIVINSDVGGDWNMISIFPFSWGMSPSQLTFIFFRGVQQVYHQPVSVGHFCASKFDVFLYVSDERGYFPSFRHTQMSVLLFPNLGKLGLIVVKSNRCFISLMGFRRVMTGYKAGDLPTMGQLPFFSG